MRFRHTSAVRSNSTTNMTAMIDIVFLLLVFFVMTFRVTAMEGDFAIEPTSLPEARALPTAVPDTIMLRLTADESGGLRQISFNGEVLDNWTTLTDRLADIAAAFDRLDRDPVTVVLASDLDLHYELTIAAITAVETINQQATAAEPSFRLQFAGPGQ